jgi:heat-inducible transcriptional repressor
MKQFSFVAATYREGNRPIGAIGIIGPTRMNYAQAITLVDTTAKFITDIFSYYK